jgi:hypothetical protein
VKKNFEENFTLFGFRDMKIPFIRVWELLPLKAVFQFFSKKKSAFKRFAFLKKIQFGKTVQTKKSTLLFKKCFVVDRRLPQNFA